MPDFKISIITPFYNSEEFMEIPYKSLINQTYQNWEWICVDDKSKDNTLKILQDWAKKDKRIKVIAREKNGGNAAAGFNSGIPYISSSHVQILGHDDELSPDTLEEIVKRIDETKADIIIPDVEVVNELVDPSSENFKMIAISPDKKDKTYPVNDRSVVLEGREACKLTISWRIHGWACYGTDLLKKTGFIEEGMNGDEYSERIFFLNAKKVAFSKGTYRYLRRPTSITHKLSVSYFNQFPTQDKLQQLIRKNHFGKKYEKVQNNCLLTVYFCYQMKLLTKGDELSKEDYAKVTEIMEYGRKLQWKYCSIIEILSCRLKYLKYQTIYKIWKCFDKKLRKKKFI